MSQFLPIPEDDKLLKKILKEGTGPHPKEGEKIKVDYTVSLKETNSVIESTIQKEPYRCIVGQITFKPANVGITTMKVGERAQFEVESQYLFGEHLPKNIKPDATVIIDAELLEIMQVFDNVADAIAHATQLNEEAATKFRNGEIDAALNLYDKALGDVEDYTDEEASPIKIRTQRNLALLYSKKGAWRKSLLYANQVLEKLPDDLKALMRKIESLINIESFDEAKKELQRALTLTKNDPAFVALRTKLENSQKLARQRENQAYAKMFAKSTKE